MFSIDKPVYALFYPEDNLFAYFADGTVQLSVVPKKSSCATTIEEGLELLDRCYYSLQRTVDQYQRELDVLLSDGPDYTMWKTPNIADREFQSDVSFTTGRLNRAKQDQLDCQSKYVLVKIIMLQVVEFVNTQGEKK